MHLTTSGICGSLKWFSNLVWQNRFLCEIQIELLGIFHPVHNEGECIAITTFLVTFFNRITEDHSKFIKIIIGHSRRIDTNVEINNPKAIIWSA